MFIRKPGVSSVDIGFANCKHTVHDSPGSYRFTEFPSIAPVASRTDLSAGALGRRDTTIVSVDGVLREVGPDAHLVAEADHAHVADSAYISTPEYRALSLAALGRMGVTHIDLLVTGAPVSRVGTQAKTLQRIFEGTHEIGDRCIVVKHVKVIAQPLGGVVYAASAASRLPRFRDETTWTIDVGGGTTDSLVSRGFKILPKLCDTHHGGVGTILRVLKDEINAKFDVECSMFSLEKALRTGTLSLRGQRIDIRPHLRAARPVVDRAINALMSRLGNDSEIDRIVLVGGGAPFFAPGIRARFPRHPIDVCDAGIFANVRGFQIAGEQLAASMGLTS